jgi:hypothetical protein
MTKGFFFCWRKSLSATFGIKCNAYYFMEYVSQIETDFHHFTEGYYSPLK